MVSDGGFGERRDKRNASWPDGKVRERSRASRRDVSGAREPRGAARAVRSSGRSGDPISATGDVGSARLGLSRWRRKLARNDARERARTLAPDAAWPTMASSVTSSALRVSRRARVALAAPPRGSARARAARKKQPNAPRIQLVARGERHVLGVHVHLVYRPGGLVHRHRLRRGDVPPGGPLRAQARERARGRRGGGRVHVAILRSHHSGRGVSAARGRLDARRERRARARHHQGFRRKLASEAVKRNDGATKSALRALWPAEGKTHARGSPGSRDL